MGVGIMSFHIHPFVVNHVLGMCLNRTIHRLHGCETDEGKATGTAIWLPLDFHVLYLTKARKVCVDPVLCGGLPKAAHKNAVCIHINFG